MTSLALGVVFALSNPTTKSLLDELETYDKLLVASQRQIDRAVAERQETSTRLSEIEVEIGLSRAEATLARERLTTRVRALSKLRGGSGWMVFRQAESVQDYIETTRLLKRLAHHDMRLHEEYRQETDTLAKLVTELTDNQNRLTQTVETSRQEHARLEKARAERESLLKRIGGDTALSSRLAAEKQRAHAELQQMVANLEPVGTLSARFQDNRGRLPWPAAGRMLRSFGQRVERAYGTATAHNGLDIGSQVDDPVYAIAEGKVVFADWLRGYGQIVIVDHGDKYHSLVAHLGSIETSVGATVQPGQLLGTVGETGSTEGPRLYFEIRHRGAPVDPLQWVRHN